MMRASPAAAVQHVGRTGRENTEQAKVVGGPLWKTLDAVRAEEERQLNDDLLSGIGIQAAEQILTQFERELR